MAAQASACAATPLDLTSSQPPYSIAGRIDESPRFRVTTVSPPFPKGEQSIHRAIVQRNRAPHEPVICPIDMLDVELLARLDVVGRNSGTYIRKILPYSWRGHSCPQRRLQPAWSSVHIVSFATSIG